MAREFHRQQAGDDHHPSPFVTNLPRMQRDLDCGPVPAAAIHANARKRERGNVGKYGTRETLNPAAKLPQIVSEPTELLAAAARRE